MTTYTDEYGTSVPPVHRRAIIVDGHCDTPYRLNNQRIPFDRKHPGAHVDFDTLRRSGITASFFAAYVPPHYANRGAADFANRLIDLIHATASEFPEDLILATDSADIRAAKQRGKIALLIGIEGGHAIEDSLELLTKFYERGARYLTLTHVNTNNWADSSGDAPRHNGLTSFGREVVQTMNSLGMIVDVSHVADSTFYHVLETSRVPVIASHSSCRALANHPRNLTDTMLKDLDSAGGVCMINFFSAFLVDEAAQISIASKRIPSANGPGQIEEDPDDAENWDDYCRWFASLNCPSGTIDTIVDHIAHAADVAGVECVGIGSDFDGVPLLPEGMGTADRLPALTKRMLERGFHEPEIEKVLGGNFMRAFDAIEKGAKRG